MTPGRQALRNIDTTMNSGTAQVDITEDNRTKIVRQGKTFVINTVQRIDKNSFKCTYVEEGSTDQTEQSGVFSSDEVLKGALLSEESNLVQAFAGEEQELVKLYFTIVKSGEKALESLKPAEVNDLIKKVAQKGGM
jgi:hypothetical protein